MKTAQINNAQHTLELLHNDAKKDFIRIGKVFAKSIFRPVQPIDFKNAYLPISKTQGENMQQLIIDHNCKNIVEFGASFGISTIYLANAARHTNGKVISTELIESKANKAMQNIKDAGLSDYVEIKIGDAIQTLSTYSEPIDFLFLDGWKDLYLPLLKMLEPHFYKNTLIYADNMDMNDTRNYADYIQENNHKYSTKITDSGKAFLSKFL